MILIISHVAALFLGIIIGVILNWMSDVKKGLH